MYELNGTILFRYLTAEWVDFPERLLGFILFDTGKPIVQSLVQRYIQTYIVELRDMLLGRYVSGCVCSVELVEGLYEVLSSMQSTLNPFLIKLPSHEYTSICLSHSPALTHSLNPSLTRLL